MNNFISKDFNGSPFVLFSIPHIAALLVIAVYTAFICIFLRKTKHEIFRVIFRYATGIILILNELSYDLWHIYVGGFNPGEHLPFHLCGMAVILSCLTLITKNYTLYEIIYFWGIGGGMQALITPDIGIYGFPHYRYFQVFISHGLIITSVFYMTFVEKYRPRLLSVIKVFFITLFALIMISFLNLATNGNYMYVCRKPQTASVIDYLGPWPYYILGMFAIGIVTFVILYLPFLIVDLIKKKRNNSMNNAKNIKYTNN